MSQRFCCLQNMLPWCSRKEIMGEASTLSGLSLLTCQATQDLAGFTVPQMWELSNGHPQRLGKLPASLCGNPWASWTARCLTCARDSHRPASAHRNPAPSLDHCGLGCNGEHQRAIHKPWGSCAALNPTPDHATMARSRARCMKMQARPGSGGIHPPGLAPTSQTCAEV